MFWPPRDAHSESWSTPAEDHHVNWDLVDLLDPVEYVPAACFANAFSSHSLFQHPRSQTTQLMQPGRLDTRALDHQTPEQPQAMIHDEEKASVGSGFMFEDARPASLASTSVEIYSRGEKNIGCSKDRMLRTYSNANIAR
jgi:hypothetical protein